MVGASRGPLEDSAGLMPVLIELGLLQRAEIDRLLTTLENDRAAGDLPVLSALLDSDASAESVQAHLASVQIRRGPAGERAWLRVHDPRVWLHLPRILGVAESGDLFGPVGVWTVFIGGHWVTTVPPRDAHARSTAPATPAAQWVALERVGAVNRVLASRGWLGHAELQARSPAIDALLVRGRARHGLERLADLVAYASLGISVHPRFDEADIAIGAIEAHAREAAEEGSQADSNVVDALAAIAPEQWAQARRELDADAVLKYSTDDEYLQHQLAWIRETNERIKAGAPKVAKAFGESQARQAWPKYQERIDAGALGKFKAMLAKFQSNAAAIIDRRTPSLIHWLEAPLFLDTLNDFHGKNIEDGLLFEEVVAEAMFGIGSCPSGAQKVQAWIEQCKATMESNLLWRVVALNQDDARAELDAALAEAKQHKSEQTLATTLVWANYTNKSLKAFADTYKKAQGVFDGNTRAASETGSVAFGARLRHFNMRGTDKFAISVGDAVVRAFRIDKLADYASEKIIQHIFSIRGFVNPADSINLIVKQAQAESLLREQTLQRLRTARVFLAADTPAIRSAQAEALRGEWKKFKAGGSDASASAMKDARLALVVGLIEGMNFAKLLADCEQKNDMKSWLSLVASGLAFTSAVFDIGAVAAKNLPSMGNASWAYQSLKLWGGVMSSGASFIGGALDLRDAGKQRQEGYTLLFGLYAFKGGLAIASGALTLAVTFTYSAPLIARLTGQAALGVAVRAVGARVAAFIGLRILGMAVGGWITVGAITIQVVIWWVTPDALEKWIDHSGFGKKRDSNGYPTAEKQAKALQEALSAMGFQ